MGFGLQIADFSLDLRLKLVAGALELVERLAQLPTDFRQFLRAEDDEGHEEDESHLCKAEIHIWSSYCLRPFGSNRSGDAHCGAAHEERWPDLSHLFFDCSA